MKSYFKFLSRNKAYAAIDVFGLAVSMMFVVLIGCYTWQEWHIDRQHTKANRMYHLGVSFDGEPFLGSHWYLQFLLKEKFPEIESSTAIYLDSRTLKYDEMPIQTNSLFVDSTFYDIFDFRLIQGDPKRVFSNPANIVVTPEYARKVWGEEDPIGKSILFGQDEVPLIVAGVMEPMKNTALMTREKRPVDMLINFSMMRYVNPVLVQPEMANAVGSSVVLLAKEGHDLTTRKKEYEEALKPSYWLLNLPEDDIRLEIMPFEGSYFSDARSLHFNRGNPKLIKLLFSVGIVILLFAIMNYINLTVALSGRRAKEMATRRLLGESRQGIMWRLIGESGILCAFSMIAGIGLAFLFEPYASSLLKTPIDISGCANLTTVGFLVVVLLIMSFVSGIIPALMLSSMKPIEAVKGAFKRKSNMIFGKVFIVIQNVSTITMIACALTMYLQVRHLIDAPLGYDTDGIIILPYQYSANHSTDADHFREELLKLPCVEKVSFAQGDPHSQGNNNTMTHEGRTISFQSFVCDTAFMDLLGLKLKRDNHVTSPVKHYLNGRSLNELGLDEDAMSYPYYDETPPIAGIVEDFRIGNVLSEQHPVRIVTVGQSEQFNPWTVLIKVNGGEREAVRNIKEVFERVYPASSVDSTFEKSILHEKIEDDFAGEERLAIILIIFAIIAIMISMLGLMAMSTYYVNQRASEIAVNKVMGATSREILVRLVRTFMTYVLISAVVAVPIIYYVMNDWLAQFSYRISLDWWIYAVSALFAIVVCFISVVVQCSKAANTNPINSLK